MHIKRRSALAVVASLVLLAGAVAVPAYATSPHEDETTTGAEKETPPEQDPLPLDLTGDAAASEERDRLQSLLAPLRPFNAGHLWDGTTGLLTVRMTTEEALDQARNIISSSGTKLTTEFALADYSAHELDDLAHRLLTDQLSWAGATGIGGGHFPLKNRVVLEVDPDYEFGPTLIAAIEKLNDPRVELRLFEPVEDWAPESRVADYQPYTAGARLVSDHASPQLCTLGWTWRLWGSGEIVGSTARHCQHLDWENGGRFVGTVFQSKQPADSALMRGTTYSPTVFVGGTPSNPNTNVVRRVVALDTSWSYGDVVAMSGATTGLTTNAVQASTYTLPSCAGQFTGLTGVLMQNHTTDGGDSGGPWLTTQSGTGFAVAHGQHFGHGCASDEAGSFFIKLNQISSLQSASILFY